MNRLRKAPDVLYGNRSMGFGPTAVGASGITSFKVDINSVNGIENAEWKKWHAWYPIKTQQGKWVWFDTTYRRKTHLVIKQIAARLAPLTVQLSLTDFVYADGEEVLMDKFSETKKQKILHLICNPTEKRVSIVAQGSTYKNTQLIE